MFRACHAHHQEKQIVSIQLLVIVTPCWWQCRHCHQHGVTITRSCIDTICFSWWWTWHARNWHRTINKYIEKNLCINLDSYQESMHDAGQQNVKFMFESQQAYVWLLTIEVLPYLKRWYHPWHCVRLKQSSPKACCNIWKVSVKVFPNLKQNLTQTRCSSRSLILELSKNRRGY